LAHIAACHLKEKNFVHVTGRLSADPPHLNANQGQANIQVCSSWIFAVNMQAL